jgi:hypothetical protein
MLFDVALVHQHSTADAKIRQFRSLFLGRDDVYPSESGVLQSSSYAPADVPLANLFVGAARRASRRRRSSCTKCERGIPLS